MLPVASGGANLRSVMLCIFALPVASGGAKKRSVLLCVFALSVASGGAKCAVFCCVFLRFP